MIASTAAAWRRNLAVTLLPTAGLLAADTAGSKTQAVPPAPASPWGWSASAAVRETYDSNLYLQDDDGGAPALAEVDSLITTLSVALGGTYKPCAAFNAALSYAPDVSFVHSASLEDNVAHRGALVFSGKEGAVTYSVGNSLLWIDGDDRGLVFDGVGGAPAAGGIPIRDRRDAAVFRNASKIQWTLGDFFMRPVFAYYLHDFQTVQESTAGYLNYVDRSDTSGGLDVGYQVAKGTSLVLGYRYGHQWQDQLLDNPTEYSSDYQRVLVGVEGQPWSWCKLAVSIGPDFRNFGPNVPVTFDEDEVLLHVDATVTLLPSSKDTVTLACKQYEQPGFGGRSVYEDRTFEIQWRRRLDPRLTVGAGFRAYCTEFKPPALRQDWIYTPSAVASWNVNRKLNAELSYTHDWSTSGIANTPAREFSRDVVALGLKYAFK